MKNSLYQATKKIWNSEKCDELSTRWAGEFRAATENVKANVNFNNWSPLQVFISLSSARQLIPIFSVRYHGQEVAEITSRDEVILSVSPTAYKNTTKTFDLGTPIGEFPWKGKAAAEFRASFKNRPRDQDEKRSEKWLQSTFFKKMEESGEKGFYACRPVRFADRFPIQCPVPISANTGNPIRKRGNLDILARRGQGNTHPAIWELKRPKICGSVLEQVYIYGVTLALMLRGSGGQVWYENMGFSGSLSRSRQLSIDLIVAITKDRTGELQNHLKKFSEPLDLAEENTELKPFIAYYEWDESTDDIHVHELIRIEKEFLGV